MMILEQGTQDVEYVMASTEYNQSRNKRVIDKYIIPLARANGKILDVGGGSQPLRHASHVIDIQSFPSSIDMGYMGYMGLPIRFNSNTWTSQDICNYPWPFSDNEFDFIWCTQTLEDVRDPVGVCKEMMRVGKAGYINCPSKFVELHKPINQYLGAGGYNGYWHHRWLVSVIDYRLIFEQKNAFGYGLDLTTDRTKALLQSKPKLGTTELLWNAHFFAEELIELDAESSINSLREYMGSVK